MRIVRNIVYIICGYIKLFLLKLCHFSRIRFKNVPRIPFSTRISISNKAQLNIGSNFRTENFTIVSVLKEGILFIGDNVSFGGNNRVICHDGIRIGTGTILGPNVCVYDHDHIFSKETGVERSEYVTSPIEIGENCWIGANVVILRGTTIGENCLIGAGCILKGSYPTGSKIIQKRETEIL